MHSAESTSGEDNSRQWSSRSMGSPLQHQIFYWLIRSGGRRLTYLLMYFVVAYYTLFSIKVRRRCQPYLSRRFPNQTGIKRMISIYRLVASFGGVLIDRAIVGILGPGQVKLDFINSKALFNVLENNRGLIVVMSHTGSWQVALSALGYMNRPVNLLLHREAGDIDRHFFEHRNLAFPYRIIDPQSYLGGMIEMMNALNRGEILSVMGDRVLGSPKNRMAAPFLGEEAFFPFSAFKLASAAGSPIAALHSYKTGAGEYALELARVIQVPTDMRRRKENLAPYVTQYVSTLEDFVKTYPYQFFNFFDMWK